MSTPLGESARDQNADLLTRPSASSHAHSIPATTAGDDQASSLSGGVRQQVPAQLPNAESPASQVSDTRSTDRLELPPLHGDKAVAPQETLVREVLNRWGNSGFFRLKYMGEKIFIRGISAGKAHVVELTTQYEDRAVQPAEVPYHGGPVDDRSHTPDMWHVSVPAVREFEQRVERVVVPGTERVQMCGGCAGNGRVVCVRCNGHGNSLCPHCHGSGWIEQTVAAPGPADARHHPGSNVRMVRRRCHCGTGQVRCSACAGNGVQTCARCEGSGRTKTYQELVARFHVVKQVKVLDDTPVADKVLGGLSGDTVIDVRRREIDRADSVAPDVDACVNTLLSESHAVDTRQQRLLLQELHVKEIPQLEVEYMYAGVDRRLWICGQEERVHAPGAPWHRGRYWLLLGSVVAAAAAALAGLAYMLLS